MKRKYKSFEAKSLWIWLVLFILTYARFLYFGFKYAYMLDDYIQYHNYFQYGNGLASEISRLGLLAARPLAGVADIALWSRFWGMMPLALGVISALFTISAKLLFDVFRKNFGVSAVFAVILLLAPFNFEGVYWLSAATRTVCGLFFSALSIWLFNEYIFRRKKHHLWLYALCGLLSCGFYEQAMFLSAAVPVLLAAYNIKRLRARSLFSLLTVADAAVYLVFTQLMGASALYGGRTSSFVLPFSDYYRNEVLPSVISQFKSVFVSGPLFITAKGFYRGLLLMLNEPNLIYIAIVLTGAACFLGNSLQSSGDRKKAFSGLVFGIVMAVCAAAPFFVLANPWFSLRGIIICMPGLALSTDRLWFLLFGGKKARKSANILAAVLVAVFMTASVSELHDYLQTSSNDKKIAGELISAIKSPQKGEKIAVLNVDASYLADQNYNYHEHIHGVTESGWALTGALRCLSGNKDYPLVVPLEKDKTLYIEVEQIKKYDRFYIRTKSGLKELSARPDAEGIEFFAGDVAAAKLSDQKACRGILTVEGKVY